MLIVFLQLRLSIPHSKDYKVSWTKMNHTTSHCIICGLNYKQRSCVPLESPNLHLLINSVYDALDKIGLINCMPNRGGYFLRKHLPRQVLISQGNLWSLRIHRWLCHHSPSYVGNADLMSSLFYGWTPIFEWYMTSL